MADPATPHHPRRFALHLLRILLFVGVIALIHLKYIQNPAQDSWDSHSPPGLEELHGFFPAAESVSDGPGNVGRWNVMDASGDLLGSVIRTSPQADDIIGFCGPTDTLIAFGPDSRILGASILSSRDTRDHVAEIRGDDSFLSHLEGMTWEQAADNTQVDGVTGATLTAVAIQEGIIQRLGGGSVSLRFTDPVGVADVRPLFQNVASLEQDGRRPSSWRVLDKTGAKLGLVLRLSPSADAVVGYQGPTDALVGIGNDGRVTGITLLKTYDNEEYAVHVREDDYFPGQFMGLTLQELAALDLGKAGIDGVSGATLTSNAVAQGLILAADNHLAEVRAQPSTKKIAWSWAGRDFGTAGIILLALLLSLTRLRSHLVLRRGFQVLLIGYLGLVNGDMISQAMIVGWAQHGVPWHHAGGLVMLTAAALLLPVLTRRNIYCSHICPHGAVQQLLKNRLPRKMRLPRRFRRGLRMLRPILLGWCVLVAMAALPYSLVDIEPFDAWVFQVTGWAALAVAVVGLALSMVEPMAYCRFGCPTGAMLDFFRFNARSDQWSRRDWLAVGFLVLASGLWFV